MVDAIFWWTGCIAWTGFAVLLVACGFPDGRPQKGVTVLAFYGFGPVIWRMLPENSALFDRLKQAGYHFNHVVGNYYVGLSLPTWLSRKLFASKRRRAA